MVLDIVYTSTFRRQFKKYSHHIKVQEKFESCIDELVCEKLSSQWKNHKLQGAYEGFQELHLFPDVLLIYDIQDGYCTLYKIGSHSDLFG
jgi:mRNA interferase YafQ